MLAISFYAEAWGIIPLRKIQTASVWRSGGNSHLTERSCHVPSSVLPICYTSQTNCGQLLSLPAFVCLKGGVLQFWSVCSLVLSSVKSQNQENTWIQNMQYMAPEPLALFLSLGLCASFPYWIILIFPFFPPEWTCILIQNTFFLALQTFSPLSWSRIVMAQGPPASLMLHPWAWSTTATLMSFTCRFSLNKILISVEFLKMNICVTELLLLQILNFSSLCNGNRVLQMGAILHCC